MDAPVTYPLRALTIGEIFDRAITIYIRNIVPLTLLVMTFIVPVTIAQALIAPDRGGSIADAIRAIQDPKVAQPFSPGEFGMLMLVSAISLLLLPVVNSAVAVGVANIYNGKAPAYGRCLTTALRRFWPILGTTLLFLGMILGFYIMCVLVITVLALIGTALVATALPAAIVVFVLCALLGIGFLLGVALLAMGLAFATYAASIEGTGTIAAISSAFRRIFTRKEIGKALLMILAYIALNIGILLVTAVLALVIEMLHVRILELTLDAVVSAASGALLTVLIAVYYYDVRTRSEGLDLETELATLTAAS